MMPAIRSALFLTLPSCALAMIVACASGDAKQGASTAADPSDGGAASGELDGGLGADADPLAACEGIPLEKNGVYDVDLAVVRVRGRITIDGEAPASSTDAGRLAFVATGAGKAGASAQVPVAADGSYDTTLSPGTYDVAYVPNAQACASTTTARAWPCNGHVLDRGITISAAGALDFDLATVLVRGAVTVKGQPLTTPPFVSFADAGDPAAAPALVAASSRGYEARLFAGTYDVGYAPRLASCGTTAPCNAGVVKAGVALTSSGVLDVDVPMIRVSGSVSLDGVAMTGTRRGGSIVFTTPTPAAKPGGSASTTPAVTATPSTAYATVPIGEGGAYAVALLPGSYTILYSGVPSASSTSPLPRGGGVLRENAALKHDGTLDLDVPTVAVRGNVRVNGAPARPSTSYGAAITFASKDGRLPSIASTPIAADGSYSTVVVAATYDVGFAPGATECVAGGTLPCNAAKLKTLALTKGAGALDLDMTVVHVTGKVTLNGGRLPTEVPATIAFAPSGTTESAAINVRADGTYATRLVAGSYDVAFGGADCSVEDMPLPCNGGTIQRGVSLTKSGALDVDVSSALVTGKVTVAGRAAPDSTTSRGGLRFVGKSVGSAATQPFAETGPITYKMHLLRGRYVVFYSPSSCATASPNASATASPMPCGGRVVGGCD